MTYESGLGAFPAELKTATVAWSIFIGATCAYCLLHQAIVSSITPDIGRTVTLALREWGVWAVLTPWVFRRLSASGQQQENGTIKGDWLFAGLMLLVAVAVAVAIDQVTGTRTAAASVAIFAPRYAAVLVVAYLVWHVFLRNTPTPAAKESPPPTSAERATLPATLLVSKGADECLLPIEEIKYLSAAGNYIEIGARNQRYLIRATMKQVADALPPDSFVRIHRSHIVRLQEIERIKTHRSGSGTVYLRCGVSLGLSKSCRTELQQHRLPRD